MKKTTYIFAGLLFILLIVNGCKKDAILPAKHLIFEENFQGDYNWTINGEIDTSLVEPGEADGKIDNGVLYLHATGCTEVTATLPLTSAELMDEDYEKMTITVDIEEFNASPIFSSNNKIEISFKNFYLTILPKQDINNLSMVFNLNNGNIELSNPTDAVEYTFSQNSNFHQLLVHLKSISSADCTSTANLKIESIKIYKK